MFIKRILSTLLILLLTGCAPDFSKVKFTNDAFSKYKIGKDIYISIKEDQIVDFNYLQEIFNGKSDDEVGRFNLWDKEQFQKLIDYMKENNFIIVAGKYTINQAWEFENGLFIIKSIDENNKIKEEKKETLKFQKQFE